MKSWAGVLAAAVLAVSGGGVDAAPPRGPFRSQLTVCLATPSSLHAAKREAKAIFSDISVSVTWKTSRDECPVDGVEVSILDKTPPAYHPGALGYALPFDGTYVQIFMDRIVARVPREDVPFLAAHVMVHELAHIAQAIDRHSAVGMMKPQFDAADLVRISQHSLPFTAHDIDLIHRGLEARALRLRGDIVAGRDWRR